MAKITFIFCCILYFTLPGCQQEESFALQQECTLSDLVVDVGDCYDDGTYNLTINFDYKNPGNKLFDVFVREGKLIGTYELAKLPITIKNFKPSGRDYDFIKVVINDRPGCFAVAEFKPPECKERECSITNLKTDVGECYDDGTYNLTINFDYKNPGNKLFDVFVREGRLIGTFELAKLPITIKNFKPSGRDHDFIKVVINDQPGCFAVAEFKPPECKKQECSITNLKTDVGECYEDGTYNLTINFDYKNPGNKLFDVFVREGRLMGTYELEKLPITIKNFKPSGRDHDSIKVVINDRPGCYAGAEFKPPDCKERECSITNLKTDVGECYDDGTYNLTLNFVYKNPGNKLFDVFVREGRLIGTFELAKLPITIKNFKPSGRDHDFIKVVVNDRPGCFAATEFKPPECKEQVCSITDLKADIGECTSKTTYNLLINFKHHHSTNEYFEVFIRDNVRIGTYKLSALPLKLKDFKHSGKDYDFIRICINDNAVCCKALEFKPPDCE